MRKTIAIALYARWHHRLPVGHGCSIPKEEPLVKKLEVSLQPLRDDVFLCVGGLLTKHAVWRAWPGACSTHRHGDPISTASSTTGPPLSRRTSEKAKRRLYTRRTLAHPSRASMRTSYSPRRTVRTTRHPVSADAASTLEHSANPTSAGRSKSRTTTPLSSKCFGPRGQAMGVFVKLRVGHFGSPHADQGRRRAVERGHG